MMKSAIYKTKVVTIQKTEEGENVLVELELNGKLDTKQCKALIKEQYPNTKLISKQSYKEEVEFDTDTFLTLRAEGKI